MIQVVSLPAEQTTAATDILLALVSAGCLWRLRKRGRGVWRARAWAWVFALSGLAALIGAAFHGFSWGPEAGVALWEGIYISLALVSSTLLALAAEAWRSGQGQRVWPWALGAAAAVNAVRWAVPLARTPFLLFLAAGILLAFAAYARQALARAPGAGLVAAGLLASLLGAVAQERLRTTVHWGWEFDQFGLYHLVQIVAFPLILAGLERGLGRRPGAAG